MIDYCSNCVAADGSLTSSVLIDASHTPPPHFTVEISSCKTVNGVAACSSPQLCSYGSACTATTCYQPYPTCFNYTQYIANEGTRPANVASEIKATTTSGADLPYPIWVDSTATEDVIDLAMTATDKVVNLELIRSRGHFLTYVEGVPDGQETHLPARVPA